MEQVDSIIANISRIKKNYIWNQRGPFKNTHNQSDVNRSSISYNQNTK